MDHVLTVNRLIDPINLRLAIRNPRERGARQQPQAPRNHTRLVTDDIPKQITRHHNPIQRPRVLDHQHGRTINQLMLHLQLRELRVHHLLHHPPPQPTRRQHIRLIQAPQRQRRGPLHTQRPRQPRNPLNLRARVRLHIPRIVRRLRSRLLALPKVDPPSQLPHDAEVDALAHGLLERGVLHQGLRGEVARAQVAEGVHFFAEQEEALLGADGAGAPFGAADGAEEDGVGGFGFFEGGGGQRGAVGVDGALGWGSA